VHESTIKNTTALIHTLQVAARNVCGETRTRKPASLYLTPLTMVQEPECLMLLAGSGGGGGRMLFVLLNNSLAVLFVVVLATRLIGACPVNDGFNLR
jgi:hypothetical protein